MSAVSTERPSTPAPIAESAPPETPIPSLPAFEPGPGPDGWGPLAVTIPGLGDAFARTTGVLEITEECTYLLNRHGEIGTLLIWPPESVRWDAARDVIVFQNPRYRDPPGEVVELHDGQYVVFGGGGWSAEEVGPPDYDSAQWTSPPDPSCYADVTWYVDEVETDD